MNTENNFNPEQLRAYAEKHLAREVEMMRWAASFLNAFSTARLSSHQPAGKIAEALRAMSLESFVIHTRNLIDFLYLGTAYGEPHPTDITISNYLDETTLALKLISITDNLERARDKANKLVAHLSMQRESWGFYEKAWIVSRIENDLLDALRGVVHEIPDDLQSSRLRDALSESLPLAFDLRLLPYAEEDERGPGLSISYGRDYRPDIYGNA